MLDLEAENRAMTLDEVRQMQTMKTGALIQYAAAAGGIMGAHWLMGVRITHRVVSHGRPRHPRP